MNTEKQKVYFIARYSLIPDTQIDFDTVTGITKEDKFLSWLITFQQENKKETNHHGTNFYELCQRKA